MQERREELIIRSYSPETALAMEREGRLLNEDGGYFLLEDEAFIRGVRLTEYTLTLNRMGLPELTATLICDRCLDTEWTGREYVVCRGQRYFLRDLPECTKTNTDTRYSHKLKFKAEAEILNGVYFFDTVVTDSQKDYKPISNSSKFSFYGSLREFAGRFNCALAYAGIADSVVSTNRTPILYRGVDEPAGDGFCLLLDESGGFDLDKCVELTFENEYLWQSLDEAFKAYNVPFSCYGRQIIFGEGRKFLPADFRYDPQGELLSITRGNVNDRIYNEATGLGSSSNIPYYYPNDTEFGSIVALAGPGNRSITQECIGVQRPALLVKLVREGQEIVYHYHVWHDAEASGNIDVYHSDTGWVEYGAGDDFYIEPLTSDREYKFRYRFTAPQAGVFVPGIYLGGSLEYNLLADESSRIESCTDALGTAIECDMDGVTVTSGSAGSEITLTIAWTAPNTALHIILETPEFKASESDRAYWTVGDKIYSRAGRLGLNVPASALGAAADGDVITWTSVDRMPFMDRLTVPKYRATLGVQRFYRALNDMDDPAYLDERTGEPYAFPHPYAAGLPSQYLYENEDIKPTIENVWNDEVPSKPFFEFADVAFDLHDNDDLKLAVKGSTSADFEHSFFYAKLNRLSYSDGTGDYSLDLFSMASQDDAMTIQMISGKCAGCKFKIQVHERADQESGEQIWENPVQVDHHGNIVAGDAINKINKSKIQPQQQDTSVRPVWICLQKDVETFGVIMPNRTNLYLPEPGDKFNIININLPKCYILAAERKLEKEMMESLLEKNSDRYKFDISCSRIFFAENPDVLDAADEYSSVNVIYNGASYERYIEKMVIDYKDNSPLPEIKFDLTDSILQDGELERGGLAERMAKRIKRH